MHDASEGLCQLELGNTAKARRLIQFVFDNISPMPTYTFKDSLQKHSN